MEIAEGPLYGYSSGNCRFDSGPAFSQVPTNANSELVDSYRRRYRQCTIPRCLGQARLSESGQSVGSPIAASIADMSSITRRAPPLLFPATAKHTATVIFIHGLGDTGHGWAGAVENWRRRQRLDEVKFILPHAPSIPITCNWGMRMPGWYDIVSLACLPAFPIRIRSRSAPELLTMGLSAQHTIDGNAESLRRNEDEAGILQSQAYFHELIQKEIDSGIPAERIVIGGFSQGGAMSIFSGLTARVKLGGIVALSSYLLLSLKFADLVPKPEANKDTPIFMAHGDVDQVVNTELGKKSYDMLKSMGYNATLKIYE